MPNPNLTMPYTKDPSATIALIHSSSQLISGPIQFAASLTPQQRKGFSVEGSIECQGRSDYRDSECRRRYYGSTGRRRYYGIKEVLSERVLLDYFQAIFTSEHPRDALIEEVVNTVRPTVTPEMNDRLLQPLTADEVKLATCHISVWHNNWIPRAPTFRPMSTPYILGAEARLSELIDGQIGSWKSDLFLQMFHLEEAQLILSIPYIMYMVRIYAYGITTPVAYFLCSVLFNWKQSRGTNKWHRRGNVGGILFQEVQSIGRLYRATARHQRYVSLFS
ncbi:hypothetical protein Salat_0186200 [Sesamum alatum]|uniref:Uncharacterized protein n=1 Tax=Sesamum alatum TaxID=300844 RepID=A0AAE1YYY3_9LAMI|nr:hypothetical protein Salat_0186200 [Sesamum alatum]